MTGNTPLGIGTVGGRPAERPTENDESGRASDADEDDCDESRNESGETEADATGRNADG